MAFRDALRGRAGLDLRQRAYEGSSTTLAGSYRAELHPTGSRTGQNHQAHQLALIPPHIFTFSTLLAENDEDVKTVQSLMRHANSNITMNIYTHPVSSKKRRAQSKVVGMILPEDKNK